MKYFLIFLMSLSLSQATSQILSNSYTSFQIDSIQNGLLAFEGDIYHDNQINQYFLGLSNGGLVQFTSTPSSIVMNKSGDTLPNSTNTYYDFPINASNIQSTDITTFSVIGNGSIRVLKEGVYSITAGLSCRDMPAGGTKYIIALYINGGLRGYISRGFVTLPSTDYWGSSGAIMYNLQANDVVGIRYVLNAGVTLNAAYMNIGINKL